MPPLLERFGRLHPLFLHLPIGLLLGALVLEILATQGKLARAALTPYVWLAALSAVVSAAAGWVLGHEDYGGDTFEWHERLGIALAIAAVIAALAHALRGSSAGRLTLYRIALVGACMMLVPAGHLGSQLTHGAEWLAGPQHSSAREPAPTPANAAPVATTDEHAPVPAPTSSVDASPPPANAPDDTYATRVAPILAERCGTCHGPTKRKGHLRLDAPEWIRAGGESGPVVVAGDPGASAIIVRTKLPLDHEDHMPPDGKPQPTGAELAVLEAWVAAGAPFGAEGASAPAQAPRGGNAPASEPRSGAIQHEGEHEGTARDAVAAEPAAPPAAALDALDRAFVHHERLPGKSELLRVEIAAVAPTFGDTQFRELVLPLAPWIAELSLARSVVTDASLAELAHFPELVRLDLASTATDDAALAALGAHPKLATLVVARTHLTDAAVDALAALPALRELFAWSAGLSSDALARLRALRPELAVTGDEPAADALAVEGELALSSDRPLPGAELVPEALRPINAKCPVSGSPVNPKYAVLHGTRVVGFCCPNCPKEFWADPAKFESKLP